MKRLLAIAVLSLGLVGPLAAKPFEPYKYSSSLTDVMKRKFYVFGFVAEMRCQVGKSLISQSVAKDIISDELIAKDSDFLNDERVLEYLATFSQYLYDNSEDCDIPNKEMVDDNMSLFKGLAEVITKGKIDPSK